MIDKKSNSANSGSLLSGVDWDRSSLYWKPRYLVPSDVDHHIPLIFWLVDLQRPLVAVTLGLNGSSAHFAACQAFDKLDLDGECVAVNLPVKADSDGADADLIDASVVDFSSQNYSDLSYFVSGEDELKAKLDASSSVDLLIVNTPVTAEVLEHLSASWKSKLSDRAVLLLLRGVSANISDETLAKSLGGKAAFLLGGKANAKVVLFDGQYDPRLEAFASLKVGQSGYRYALSKFARLGEGCAATVSVANATKSMTELEVKLASTDNALREKTFSYDRLYKQYNERSEQAGISDALVFDERKKTSIFQRKLREAEAIASDLDAKVNALQSKVDELHCALKVAKAASVDSKALKERMIDIGVLGLELKNLKLAEKQRAVLAKKLANIEKSTSWRLTKPVRALGGAVKRFR